ncbi:hypothetical protein EJ06DRAFT_528301 [Trichodelitschia bisporula]|uniref:CFEM domain-containing protein n=1 Tax=Trichodelitschia bisporula TaxID=703511 RepID=A0A6G1I1W1_9PEZI|nr:hypothetical protein EJ06DRAFT_528301 [Trichodelitschia bisporula]
MVLLSIVVALLCAAFALGDGPGLNGLPQCAAGCVNNAVFISACNPTDVLCLCSDTALINGISCCLPNSCSPNDRIGALHYFAGFCQEANKTITLDTLQCPLDSNSTTPTHSSNTTTSSSTPLPEHAHGLPQSTKLTIGIAAGVVGLALLLVAGMLLHRRSSMRRLRREIEELKAWRRPGSAVPLTQMESGGAGSTWKGADGGGWDGRDPAWDGRAQGVWPVPYARPPAEVPAGRDEPAELQTWAASPVTTLWTPDRGMSVRSAER